MRNCEKRSLQQKIAKLEKSIKKFGDIYPYKKHQLIEELRTKMDGMSK